MGDKIEKLVKEIKEKDKDILVAIEKISQREPVFSDFKFENDVLNEKLRFKLYKHQVEGLKILYSGKNLIITTPTASGKSEIYRLYILDKYLSNNSRRFLLIFPTRALLYDQYEKFEEMKKYYGINIKTGVLLGDLTTSERREVIKERPNVIFTTPDTLHLFILKNHHMFSWFFKNLKLIVIDELHSYRGVFGTNSAYLFRRLFRLLKYYYKRDDFQVMLLSATLRNPTDFAKKLLGIENIELIEEGYHKAPEKYLLVIDPQEKYNGLQYLKILVSELLKYNIKSLVFLETKRLVERMRLMFLFDTDLVEVYKGSLTRTQRREIENKFKRSEIIILFTTSALELGIDIGDVEGVVNYGIPPDGLFSLIQRFGRAARIKKGINVLVLRNDVLDAYYKENLRELIDRIKKNIVDEIPVNLSNRNVVKNHLKYLLYEVRRIPISELNEYEIEIAKELERENYLRFERNWFLNTIEIVHTGKVPRYLGLRNISEDSYYIIEDKRYKKSILKSKNLYRLVQFLKAKNIIIEEVDKPIYYEQLLPGMTYFSRGKVYESLETLDLGKFHFVFVKRVNDLIETKPLFREEVKIVEIKDKKKVFGYDVYIGKLKIRRIYEGFIKKKVGEKEYSYIGEIKYYEDPFVYDFTTKGIWIVLKEDLKEVEDQEYKMFYNKVKKYLEKINRKDLLAKIELFVSTVDKEEIYNRFRGAATRKIVKIISRFLSYNGLDPEKHKKLVFYIKKLIDSRYGFRSGIHAIEHNIIKISPVVTNVDSRELGGYSYEFYPSDIYEFNGKPIIFIYEAYEGGVGLSEILFENIEKLILKSYERIRNCKCLDGCPKCVLSPKCGNANEFLDKYTARFILKRIVYQKKERASKP